MQLWTQPHLKFLPKNEFKLLQWSERLRNVPNTITMIIIEEAETIVQMINYFVIIAPSFLK